MFYLTTHTTHFIYGYMASDIWLRIILIVRKVTRCRQTGYSYRLTTRVLLYAPSHRQNNTYNGLCYTSRGALAGTRNSSLGPPHEGSIRRPIVPSTRGYQRRHCESPSSLCCAACSPTLSWTYPERSTSKWSPRWAGGHHHWKLQRWHGVLFFDER